MLCHGYRHTAEHCFAGRGEIAVTTGTRVLIAGLPLVTAPIAAEDRLLRRTADTAAQRSSVPVDFSGPGRRSNPWRYRLPTAFTGDELFVRYRLRYDGRTIETPVEG